LRLGQRTGRGHYRNQSVETPVAVSHLTNLAKICNRLLIIALLSSDVSGAMGVFRKYQSGCSDRL
jgi:hypothetical protein